METSVRQPLDRVRILDFTIMMQGPHATQMLADLGADVIKVERPGNLGGPSGHPDERYGPHGGYSQRPEENTFYASSFLAHNRNKKSITIDLKKERGREIIRRLIKTSDVVYENFRPDVMPRLGFGYADCCALNPSIIYASATGYGPDGPYVDRPGQDLLVQSLTGLAAMNAVPDGRPLPVPFAMMDLLGAAYGAYGVLAALYHRQQTGEGQQVNVCLLNSGIAALSEVAFHFLNTGSAPDRGTPMHGTPYLPPPYAIHKTKDGYLSISGSRSAPTLLKILGLGHLLDDPRFNTFWTRLENRAELEAVMDAALQHKTTAEWLALLREADLWASPVNTLAEAVTDPQVLHNEMVVTVDSPVGPLKMPGIPYKLSKTPAQVRSAPPLLGQHTEEVLGQLGYGPEELAQLRQEQVI